MWEFICKWLPVLAFLSGTLLGWVINSLFERVRRQHLEKLYKNASNANVALESQLVSKNTLESDLSRTNTEIEELRKEIKLISQTPKVDESASQENFELKQEIKALKEKATATQYVPKKDYTNDYQVFLSELEQSIKKAKEHSFNVQEAPAKKKKKKKKSKKKEQSKATSKYDFYKEKYAGKKITDIIPEIISEKVDKIEEEKDLTYLYGINKKIQKILNQHDIVTFSDLSNTKIKNLKAILAHAGKKYKNIDPLNWPIQARIAEKGQWDILDEYKSKMEM
ncbi:hypothetical protein [Portibacter lacus]|nr:hypothetical protein [Portibacter lacus]